MESDVPDILWFSDRICAQAAMNAPSAESIATASSHAVVNVRPEAYHAVGLGSATGSAMGHKCSPSFVRGGSSEEQFDWTSNVANVPAEPNALAGLGPDSPKTSSTGSPEAMATLPLSVDLVDPSNGFLLTYCKPHRHIQLKFV
ncbi:unnamed protein product [Aspergillus oryzae]|uniref:Unnamed protein product n=1 Tax=Aspergillus oryzae TaxID=5062 RepID=A0AAN5BSC2_ASPOZ|nr:unnamed protein product [Aspergillus oryzae]GMF83738.1 unnamed protein product [Aspergillus oryzae]GMG06082.1 unnamed protein product [Aspergillus oryzae]GMG23558.1 unnamed protein product [Aspergillus oryzae]